MTKSAGFGSTGGGAGMWLQNGNVGHVMCVSAKLEYFFAAAAFGR